jgi:hypothetical protein
MEFPFMSKEGKFFEAFPMIVLHLNNGERIELDYFGSKSLSYIPTRFMQKAEGVVIPMVKYLSKFKSEKEVVQNFMEEVVAEMRENYKNIFSINGNVFVNWDNVCKVEVVMNHYVYCYDNPIIVGNSKHVRSEENARWVCLSSEFELDDEMEMIEGVKKEEEISLGFLSCPQLESK